MSMLGTDPLLEVEASDNSSWTGWHLLSPRLRFAAFWDGGISRAFGPRYVQDYQILMVQAGVGEAIVNDQSFNIATGDLIYYGPKELHAVQSSRQKPLRLMGLHFIFHQDDWWRLNLVDPAYGSPIPYEYPRGELHISLDPHPPTKTSPGTASSAFRLCESLVLSHLSDPSGRQLEKRGLLLLLFESWYKTILTEATGPILSPLHRRIVEQAQVAILDNLRQPPDIAALCKANQISERYFLRLFRAGTAMSVRQFILTQRLIWARRLLIAGQFPVNKVAATVGFDDPHYFSRCFMKQFGIKPSVVRSDRQLI